MRALLVVTVVVTLAATSALTLGGLLAAPAFAKTCGTLTKKEASEILGFKVVTTKELSEADTEGCDYVTKKFWSKRFKKLDAPLKLRITVQPLTPETEGVLKQLESDEDAEPVDGIGDRAFYTDSNDLVAVVGDQVFQSEVTNIEWKGNELTKNIKQPERAAMQQLVDSAG
jgi:hypothetical protein